MNQLPDFQARHLVKPALHQGALDVLSARVTQGNPDARHTGGYAG